MDLQHYIEEKQQADQALKWKLAHDKERGLLTKKEHQELIMTKLRKYLKKLPYPTELSFGYYGYDGGNRKIDMKIHINGVDESIRIDYITDVSSTKEIIQGINEIIKKWSKQ